MPASEFFGWQEYFSIYPFSEDRADIRAAQLMNVVYNASGGKATVEKFMPKYLQPDRSLKEQDDILDKVKKSLESAPQGR